MTENQKEACSVLIEHARTKDEVLKAMLGAFPKMNKKELILHIAREWKKRYEVIVSLRKKSYKEKFDILFDLINRKKNGEFRQVFIHLNKGLDKSIDQETYAQMVGKGNLSWPGREGLRGKEVELIGFIYIFQLID